LQVTFNFLVNYCREVVSWFSGLVCWPALYARGWMSFAGGSRLVANTFLSSSTPVSDQFDDDRGIEFEVDDCKTFVLFCL